MHEVAGGIELEHGRRHGTGGEFGLVHVLPVEHQHVVAGVDAQAAKAAVDPVVREWPVPGGIELITRRGPPEWRRFLRWRGCSSSWWVLPCVGFAVGGSCVVCAGAATGAKNHAR